MLYSKKVMDHFTNPRNVGTIEDADGIGEVGNAKCGDIMKIYLKMENKTKNDNFIKILYCNVIEIIYSNNIEIMKKLH